MSDPNNNNNTTLFCVSIRDVFIITCTCDYNRVCFSSCCCCACASVIGSCATRRVTVSPYPTFFKNSIALKKNNKEEQNVGKHTHIHTHIHTYTHTQIHKYTHTHKYTYPSLLTPIRLCPFTSRISSPFVNVPSTSAADPSTREETKMPRTKRPSFVR